MKTRTLLFLWVLVAGCEGELLGQTLTPAESTGGGTGAGGGQPTETHVAPLRYACHEGPQPGDAALKRVSVEAWRRAVREVAAGLTGDDDTAFLDEALASVPDDERVRGPGDTHGGFSRLDQTIQQTWVNKTVEVAQLVAHEATHTAARRASWVGACSADAGADAQGCLRQAMERLAGLTLRRAPTGADVELLLSAASPTAPLREDSLANTVALALLTPDFLYDAELPGALSGDALARRLAEVLWQDAPDAPLLAAAASGALSTDEGLRAQFRRMLADPRVAHGVGQLFGEWLRLPETPQFDLEAGLPAWEQQFGALNVGPATRQHAIDDVVGAALAAVREDRALASFLRDDGVYSTAEDLAALYEVPAWDGVGPAPSPPGRAGLLTRPALVASGGSGTRPIMKGYFVRSALLCMAITLPSDPTVFAQATSANAAPSGDGSTRDHVTGITSGAACAGCHATLLNPAGFATEGFDGLGRRRATETLFTPDGQVSGHATLDTRGAPNVIVGDDAVIDDARGLTELLVQSGLVESCFVRNAFRFTFQRLEDASSADGCLLASAEQQARAGGSLADVLETFVMSDTFRHRRTEEAP